MAPGAVALAAGARLTPGAIALGAMIDCAEVEVARRPSVVVLCTGDELRPVGAQGSAESIPESNSAALLALAAQAGARGRAAPTVADEPEAVERALRGALEGTDLLVTVGGVSVGEHDLVRPALDRVGVSLDFWKVAIKPGKPIAVGRAGATRVLCLPGNPASALVTFGLFGMPLLRALQGDTRPSAPHLPAVLAAGRKRSPDRLELLRSSLAVLGGRLVARPHDNQASGAATSLAASDGLALVPPGPAPIEAGAPVEFVRWVDL
jgi:molybdopterin molybdotransferase